MQEIRTLHLIISTNVVHIWLEWMHGGPGCVIFWRVSWIHATTISLNWISCWNPCHWVAWFWTWNPISRSCSGMNRIFPFWMVNAEGFALLITFQLLSFILSVHFYNSNDWVDSFYLECFFTPLVPVQPAVVWPSLGGLRPRRLQLHATVDAMLCPV